MEKKCILFTGLQASGKTTFYGRYFQDLVHVNLDTLHTRNKERLLIEACFASGRSFVVENTNPTREARAGYIDSAKGHGYRVIGYYFNLLSLHVKNGTADGQGNHCSLFPPWQLHTVFWNYRNGLRDMIPLWR